MQKSLSENLSHPLQVALLADSDNDISGFQYFSRSRVENHLRKSYPMVPKATSAASIISE